jgi:hypothetical protein
MTPTFTRARQVDGYEVRGGVIINYGGSQMCIALFCISRPDPNRGTQTGQHQHRNPSIHRDHLGPDRSVSTRGINSIAQQCTEAYLDHAIRPQRRSRRQGQEQSIYKTGWQLDSDWREYFPLQTHPHAVCQHSPSDLRSQGRCQQRRRGNRATCARRKTSPNYLTIPLVPPIRRSTASIPHSNFIRPTATLQASSFFSCQRRDPFEPVHLLVPTISHRSTSSIPHSKFI